MFNEEQLKLFDYLNDSVLIYNRDGRLVFTNKVYEDLLGITRESTPGPASGASTFPKLRSITAMSWKSSKPVCPSFITRRW